MSHRSRLSDELQLIATGERGETLGGNPEALASGSLAQILAYLAREFPYATIGGVWLINDGGETIGRIIGKRDRRRGIRSASGETLQLETRKAVASDRVYALREKIK